MALIKKHLGILGMAIILVACGDSTETSSVQGDSVDGGNFWDQLELSRDDDDPSELHGCARNGKLGPMDDNCRWTPSDWLGGCQEDELRAHLDQFGLEWDHWDIDQPGCQVSAFCSKPSSEKCDVATRPDTYNCTSYWLSGGLGGDWVRVCEPGEEYVGLRDELEAGLVLDLIDN